LTVVLKSGWRQGDERVKKWQQGAKFVKADSRDTLKHSKGKK
jgi:hypothetical protein